MLSPSAMPWLLFHWILSKFPCPENQVKQEIIGTDKFHNGENENSKSWEFFLNMKDKERKAVNSQRY